MEDKILKTTTIINKPLIEVFDFFSKAENLNVLTPPKVQFKILTPLPIPMFPGQIIKYRIKLFGIPFFWKTEINFIHFSISSMHFFYAAKNIISDRQIGEK